MKTPVVLKVAAGGRIRAIYDDALSPLVAQGAVVTITRASHVEPTPDGLWTADMSPSAGPLLGPFTTRAQALEAEVRWLKEHRNL